MDDLIEKIQKKIQSNIEKLSYELVDIECHQGKKSLNIVIYIDHIRGITVDDCVKVTKVISPIIDKDSSFNSFYNLEVSSPGLNRKLLLKEHFDKHIGNVIKVKLKTKIDNRKIYKGELVERKDDKITIFENNKKILINMKAIEICRLVPAFK